MYKIQDSYGYTYEMEYYTPNGTGAIFHIGGGRENGFYRRSGVIEFIGLGDYDYFINLVTRYCHLTNRRNGKFCTPYYADDASGSLVAYYGDKVFNFDENYDTYIFRELADLDDSEIEILVKEGVLHEVDD